MKGYIYLIRDFRTHFTKIGFSDNPYRRLKELTREPTLLPQPFNFKIIDAFQGTIQEEKRLHLIFSPWRVRGEWFDLCTPKSFGISDAFDCRPRLSGIGWNRCHDDESSFELLECVVGCRCEECRSGRI